MRPSRKLFSVIAASAAVHTAISFLPQVANAANDTWTGNDSPGNTNWSDSNNWSNTGNAPPVNGDALFFDGSNTTSNDDYSVTANGISFNSTAGVFKIT